MRRISRQAIAEALQSMLVTVNTQIPSDVWVALENARSESCGVSSLIMEDIINNAILARDKKLPLCQDTGLVIVFAKLGIGVMLEEPLQQTVDKSVAEVYLREGYRPSIVKDPLARVNTGNNLPSIVYIDSVPGDSFELDVMVKGFGSENMSRSAMLTPAQGYTGVKDFVIETVKNARGNPCPPVIIGVGVGGTFEYCAMLSKKALLRRVGEHHIDPAWAEREIEILTSLNELNIGPGGVGGGPTALAVNIESAPTHIAGLPVAVNISCHSSRHGTVII